MANTLKLSEAARATLVGTIDEVPDFCGAPVAVELVRHGLVDTSGRMTWLGGIIRRELVDAMINTIGEM